MNGINYLLDTNALISFFQGNPKLRQFISSASLKISVISVLEFLSFKEMNEADKKLLFDFIQIIEVIELKSVDTQLINTIADVRTTFRLKLPDAIIAGSAIYKNATLISNDRDFGKLPILKTINF